MRPWHLEIHFICELTAVETRAPVLRRKSEWAYTSLLMIGTEFALCFKLFTVSLAPPGRLLQRSNFSPTNWQIGPFLFRPPPELSYWKGPLLLVFSSYLSKSYIKPAAKSISMYRKMSAWCISINQSIYLLKIKQGQYTQYIVNTRVYTRQNTLNAILHIIPSVLRSHQY